MPNSILMTKIIFMKYLPQAQIGPKIKNAQNLLKLAHLLCFKYVDLVFDVKNNFY